MEKKMNELDRNLVSIECLKETIKRMERILAKYDKLIVKLEKVK